MVTQNRRVFDGAPSGSEPSGSSSEPSPLVARKTLPQWLQNRPQKFRLRTLKKYRLWSRQKFRLRGVEKCPLNGPWNTRNRRRETTGLERSGLVEKGSGPEVKKRPTMVAGKTTGLGEKTTGLEPTGFSGKTTGSKRRGTLEKYRLWSGKKYRLRGVEKLGLPDPQSPPSRARN